MKKMFGKRSANNVNPHGYYRCGRVLISTWGNYPSYSWTGFGKTKFGNIGTPSACIQTVSYTAN